MEKRFEQPNQPSSLLGKGLTRRYPYEAEDGDDREKQFNIDASVSIEIERHLGANRAFTTAKAHHRQHATTSPEVGHFRLRELLSSKGHPPRERQDTVENDYPTRHLPQAISTDEDRGTPAQHSIQGYLGHPFPGA
ncbi:hypothetical protein CRG98_023978 [Punica granatum]|uniref:Uncharacterized protein n=1 Tax=Punica granatum TaxID=22663 RepID=A0A2I0JHY7_PUNGR|nr:hypothetical protein CRG98_023978 [Punica granatum]